MKYDDASWHYGGKYPEDLPPEAAATHIGMFLAWIIHHDLVGDELIDDSSEELQAVRDRRITGAQFLMRICDEKLIEDDLSEIGNAFAMAYYQGENGEGYGAYIDDYLTLLAGGDENNIYRVADTWHHYDTLAPAISRRFEGWKGGHST